MFTFKLKYALQTLILFLVEVYIAMYMHDNFIRSYIGDVLVVILIYTFIKTFLNVPVKPTVIAVLLFSFVIEFAQYFKVVKLIGLGKSTLANVVLGNSFSWIDIGCYVVGAMMILIYEKLRKK